MTAIMAARPSRFSPKTAVAVVAAVLLLLVLASRGGNYSVSSSMLSSGASCSGMCTWTPFDLEPEDKRFVVDMTRLDVPSLVRETRRHLSVELAIGPIKNGVEGDIVETGVAAGGASILLLRTLQRYDRTGTRKFWAADSFMGLPDPTEQDMNGFGATGSRGEMSYGRQLFLNNLAKFNVSLPNRLRVLEGWFNETLPGAPIEKIAHLRLDGDLYASTMDALEALYDRVSPGGTIYVDDYGSFTGCRRAVDEFRERNGITAPLYLPYYPEWGLALDGKSSHWEAAWWIKPPCPPKPAPSQA